ncbi:MAG: MarR family transcriptional regulator [Methanosarcina sp.]|uniref:helix-turn-helix transcriptional regulator n=1 Tax=Methanosarcina sp. TaxID=2213 RepID=UPI002631956B|nr:MarR family transcriptional regulator [Methanosarcina sp.]MDD3247322.1 MarR family transcriptional regulator [Methanosarcina sp.]MDD4247984.1 MarR family transcriptional regulator [Methanosarcina sp.]
MNLRFCIICTAALFTLGASASLTLGASASLALDVPFLADSNTTATVHGVTYVWDTFEPLNDTLIDINSNPPQSIVAKNGKYSFELVPGDYTITARYYQNNTLTYSKEATFTIEGEGNYVFDLLLYPVSKYPATETISAKINNPNNVNPSEQTRIGSSAISYLLIALTLSLLLGGGYTLKLSRKYKNIDKNKFQEEKFNIPGLLEKVLGKSIGSGVRPGFGNLEETVSTTEPIAEPITEPADYSETEAAALKKLPISTDLRRIMDVIRSHKGQITQKDLRSRLEYSEVKVSLMLSELEKRGLIKKFKNGRENIVVLIDEKRR